MYLDRYGGREQDVRKCPMVSILLREDNLLFVLSERLHLFCDQDYGR